MSVIALNLLERKLPELVRDSTVSKAADESSIDTSRGEGDAVLKDCPA